MTYHYLARSLSILKNINIPILENKIFDGSKNIFKKKLTLVIPFTNIFDFSNNQNFYIFYIFICWSTRNLNYHSTFYEKYKNICTVLKEILYF